MKKLFFLSFLTIATCTINAQEKSTVETEIESLADHIKFIAKSQLTDAEQSEQIIQLISEFLEENPVAVYKMRQLDANERLENAKKETPVPLEKLQEYIVLQKQSYALLGDLNEGTIPRGGTEVVASETEAVTTYCEWSISTGNEYSNIPGYCVLTPEGIRAYNKDAMLLNQTLGPENKVPLIPITYAWSYSTWQQVEVSNF